METKSKKRQKHIHYASRLGIRYVLMNPLSNFGRGTSSAKQLEANEDMMNSIKKDTKNYKTRLDVVNIRFPNTENLPLSGCEAGKILYTFSNGDVTICPYLIFASNNPNSLYQPSDFIIGNLFQEKYETCLEHLNKYNFQELTNRQTKHCPSCAKKKVCGKGCPANIIAQEKKLINLDSLCPKHTR